MRIGELARKAGVNPSALRYYERLGLLKEPPRAGGKRVYDFAAVRRVGWIRLGREAGLSLRELRRLLEPGEARGDWRALLSAKREELDRRAAELRRMQRLLDAALACGCTDLGECRRGRAAAVRRSR